MEPSVEISILVYNQWASSKRTFASLIKNTNYKNCLITVLDNGSTDETSEGLKNYGFKVITNKENVGFGPGHNQVMKESQADYICLLNNDIEVEPNWLTKMVEVAESDELIGLVAPLNRTRGDLIIGGMLRRDGSGYHLYVNSLGKQEPDWLQASCLLVKRALINEIGYFDELFQMGYYEDVDYTLRARMAFFKPVVAANVLVEHYEGVTSKASGLKKFQEINRKKFVGKWNHWLEMHKK